MGEQEVFCTTTDYNEVSSNVYSTGVSILGLQNELPFFEHADAAC